jgi:hypothetical protein
MKYIRKYENFINDEDRGNAVEEPEYNPVKSLEAQKYVDIVFNKGAGDEVNQLCKEIGCELPESDEDLEKVKEIAVKYFIDNPERIKSFDQPVKTYAFNGGNSVVKTNNVGGTSYEHSPHVGESIEVDNSTKIDLNEDEMRLFGTETVLMKLIQHNKISLHYNQVVFDRNDEETKKVLDIFFEIDNVNNVSEGFGEVAGILKTIFLSLGAAYALLSFIGGLIIKKAKCRLVDSLMKKLKLLSASMAFDNNKKEFSKVVSVSEYADRYFITTRKTFFGQVPDIRVLKNEKIMIYNDVKINLSDEQYQQFLELIKYNI